MLKSLLLVFLLISVQLLAQPGQEFVTIAASHQYSNPSFFKKLMLGRNYREEWETPVQLPVFRIKQLGLVIKELGGGMQTKSLQLEDAKGQKWALRTVEKDVSPNLPKALQETLAEKIVQDMISAAHPYAPLTIPPLAAAIGVAVPSPTFFFVPDDPDLGEYRHLFANSVCMLEEREPTPDNSETENTPDALEELLEKNNRIVLQKQVLRARLLDMLIADWDRHADQWRWGMQDSAGVKYYYAIPRDRDQAYFHSNGLLIKLARKVALRHLVGFRYNLSKIKQLNFKSWRFDQTFINDLDKEEWTAITTEVQNKLTDAVIEDAVKKLPPEIYPISGNEIVSKLKNRRAGLMDAALKYYDYISQTVTISGTDEEERFVVKGSGKDLLVEVYAKDNRMLYQRIIKKSDTRKLQLIGLGGKDQFTIDGGAKSRIKIKLDGGTAEDIYDLKGSTKNTITDFQSEQNQFKETGKAKMVLH